MQENEFEKKIFSEMQGLKFKPTEQVWVKVEERIRKKKRRRTFIILFFTAGIALLGYWQRDLFWGSQQTELVNTNKMVTKNKIETPATGQSSSITKKEEIKENNAPVITITKTSKPGKKENDFDQTVVVPAAKNRQGKNSKEPVAPVNKTSFEKNQNTINPEPYQPVQKNAATETIVAGDLLIQQEGDAPISQGQKKDTAILKVSEEKKEELKPEEENRKNEVKKDSPVVVQYQNQKSKKWKWGLAFTPGISSLNESFISLNMAQSADAFAYSNTSGSSGSASGRVIIPPSESKSGFAFQIGALAQKQFSSRSGLLLGLQYGYYSDHIKVGSVINNSSGLSLSQNAGYSYAAGGSSNDYTNHYHFVELPVIYQLRLNKKESHPFTLNAGFTVSRLISTNALVYDTASGGIYYKDKNSFNKTQFSLNTGLSWTIMQGSKLQWSIGPMLDMHINSFTDNPFDSKKYIDFVGLRSAFIFSGKK